MAILKVIEQDAVGIKKEIEEGSLELIFQALQSDIYSDPVRSFVRETISNGLDSIIEKNVHKEISNGKPVSDFFKIREEDGSNSLLKDSNYNLAKFLQTNPQWPLVIVFRRTP